MTEEPMKTVYVITAGEYSDYHIMRVYDDEDEAERFVAAWNGLNPGYGNEASIEDWEVGVPAETVEGPGWEGRWSPELHGTTKLYPESFKIRGDVWVSSEENRKAWVHLRTNSGVIVHGFSREHVEKVLYDTVAQVKAENAGIA